MFVRASPYIAFGNSQIALFSMNELTQQIIAGAIVLVAIAYLALRGRFGKKKGCSSGGDCGCEVKKRPSK